MQKRQLIERLLMLGCSMESVSESMIDYAPDDPDRELLLQHAMELRGAAAMAKDWAKNL